MNRRAVTLNIAILALVLACGDKGPTGPGNPTNTPPVIAITAPANNSSFQAGAGVAFTGTATDAEDGNLSANISWSSSRDGSMGTGATLSTTALTVGTHTITASVADSRGASRSATITITINPQPSGGCTTPPPAGVTKTWVGVSGEWSSANNWSPAGVPGTTDNVLICTGTPNQPVLSADTRINDLFVDAGATFSANADRVLHVHNATTGTGSSLTGAGGMRIDGTLTVGGSYSMGSAGFFGPDGQVIPGLPYGQLRLEPNGKAVLAGPATVSGSLVIARTENGPTAELVLNGNSLEVTGDLVTQHGWITMTQASDLLTVNGGLSMDPGDAPQTALTAGLIRARGNVFTPCGGPGGLVASGTHKVILDGTAPQNVQLGCPSHRFNDLDITNTAGVSIGRTGVDNAVTVAGLLQVGSTVGITILEHTTLRVLSHLDAPANSSIGGAGTLRLEGTMAVAGNYSVATTSLFGPDGQVVPVLPYVNVRVQNNGKALLTGPTTLSGSLFIVSPAFGATAELVLGGNSLHIAGNLTTENGWFTMTQAADTLTVDGNASLLPPSIEIPSPLSAGVLRLRGNISTICGGQHPFSASASHLTIFDGTTAQSVAITCSNEAQLQRLRHVRITNTAGVSLVSDLMATGDLTLIGSLTVPASRTLRVSGAIALQAGAVLTNAGTVNAGSCSNSSGTVNNTGTIACGSGSF